MQEKQPEVILWGSDSWSKAVAPQVAALLRTGLCADCTALETDGDKFFMYRPAFSGNIVAKIACMTKPDRKAPIFDYADYGIVGTAEEVLRYLM